MLASLTGALLLMQAFRAHETGPNTTPPYTSVFQNVSKRMAHFSNSFQVAFLRRTTCCEHLTAPLFSVLLVVKVPTPISGVFPTAFRTFARSSSHNRTAWHRIMDFSLNVGDNLAQLMTARELAEYM